MADERKQPTTAPVVTPAPSPQPTSPPTMAVETHRGGFEGLADGEFVSRFVCASFLRGLSAVGADVCGSAG